MMNRLLILLFSVGLALTSSASDQLAFDVLKHTDSTVYNLQLRRGEVVRTIWSKRVPLVNGKMPDDYCNLSGWAQNEHGILALVANNEFWGQLLQFDSKGDLVAELEAGGNWLTHIRRGGSVKLEPPDKIEVTSPDGSITKFTIMNGQMADETGRIFERLKPLQIGIMTSEAPAHQPDVIDTLALSSGLQTSAPTSLPQARSKSTEQNNETTSSTLRWSVVALLIAAASGMLSLLLKRRS